MALHIVHYNEPILHQKGVKIASFDKTLAHFACEMIATMRAVEGIGLAAQQVSRAIMLCVIDLRPAKADFRWTLDGAQPPLDLFMPMVLANPEVSMAPGADDYIYEEGCLSFPKIRGDVVRPEAIAVKFRDAQGVPHALTCDGLLARCVQHEVDHLYGVLFIDRMEKNVRAEIDEAVKALAKATRAAAKAAKAS